MSGVRLGNWEGKEVCLRIWCVYDKRADRRGIGRVFKGQQCNRGASVVWSIVRVHIVMWLTPYRARYLINVADGTFVF